MSNAQSDTRHVFSHSKTTQLQSYYSYTQTISYWAHLFYVTTEPSLVQLSSDSSEGGVPVEGFDAASCDMNQIGGGRDFRSIFFIFVGKGRVKRVADQNIWTP